MNNSHYFEKYLRPFFGSMILFIVEFSMRFYLKRKLTFLNALDATVLINYYFDDSFKWKSNNKKRG
jgi:hypothetical protein